MNKAKYKRYLLSQQWKDKRRLALDFYGHKCNLCGGTHRLQVHHRHYKNLFKENIEDLMVLCESCHREFHKRKIWKNGKKSKYMRDPSYDTQTVTYYPKRSK